MTNSMPTNGKFKELEMHISNKAYRDFLLNDERALTKEDGSFNRIGMAMAVMAHLYEKEEGPEQIQEILKRYEKESSNQIS